MKRSLFILLIIFYPFSCIWGQGNLLERRIYLLDVTKSMIGQGVMQTPNIYNRVINNLVEAINEIEDPETEIIIIPFTNKTHSIIKGVISGKKQLQQEISNIQIQSGDTNIADAWSVGISFLDSTKVNYLFILTDGLHNEGPSIQELYNRLYEWKNISKNHYYFAFYVMLTENAVEQNIRNIAQVNPQMWSIESLNIKAALIRTSLSQHSNIYENKTVYVRFVSNNTKILLKDLGIKFSLQKNPYYEVTTSINDSIDPFVYGFNIAEKMDRKYIPTETELSLHINYNHDKFPLIFFTPEDIDFKIINRGIRKMTFKAIR